MHGGLNMNLIKPKFKSQRIMNILFSVLAQKPQVWKETLKNLILIWKLKYQSWKLKYQRCVRKWSRLSTPGRKRATFFQTKVWIEIVLIYLSCILMLVILLSFIPVGLVVSFFFIILESSIPLGTEYGIWF